MLVSQKTTSKSNNMKMKGLKIDAEFLHYLTFLHASWPEMIHEFNTEYQHMKIGMYIFH